MDKALEMGKTSTMGGLQLLFGKATSTFILAAGTIILGWFISPEDYGLYTIALIPATTMLLFQDFGVNSALIRNIAKFRGVNNEGDLRKTVVAGLSFEVLTGLILTLFSVLIANFIATSVFSKPESSFLIIFASITILSTSILGSTSSIFVGFEKMKFFSLVMVCQAVLQSFTAPVLVYLGYGSFGAVFGYALASVIASIISVLIFYFGIFKRLPRSRYTMNDVFSTMRPLLVFGIPLAIGTILIGVLTQFNSFLMASYVGNDLIGNYKISTNFALLLTLITAPISAVLFPAISKIDVQREKSLLRTAFSSSAKYTALLLVPSVLALAVLAQPLIGTLYGGKYPDASFFLTAGVLGNLLVIFGNLSMTGFLASVGETKLLMKMNLLSLLIGIPVSLLLIPTFGILGLIISPLIDGVPSMFIGLHIIWTRYNTRVDLGATGKILLVSGFAALVTYFVLNVLDVSDWIRLVVGGFTFMSVFLCSSPLMGAVTESDVKSLSSLFEGSGVVSKIFVLFRWIIEKVIKFRKSLLAR